MNLLSREERRTARVLLRFRLLTHAGFGDASNTAMLVLLTPLMGAMIALIELGVDAVPLLPFMPGIYFAATALVALCAVMWHAPPDVGHPGNNLLATMPRVSKAARYADANAARAVWLAAAAALFALGPFAALQGAGHTQSAQGVLSLAAVGPLVAIALSASERLRIALLPTRIGFRWAAWAALAFAAMAPVAAAAWGVGLNEAAMWGGPLWIVFAALNFAAQGGLAQFAVLYFPLLAVALGLGLIAPRFSPGDDEKKILGATPEQQATVEKLVKEFDSLKEERVGADFEPLEFGAGPREVFKALTPPEESGEKVLHRQIRSTANAASVVLLLGLAVIWVLQNGPALRSVGMSSLAAGSYAVVLGVAAFVRFPGRSIEATIQGAARQLERASKEEEKERPKPDVDGLRGWQMFGTYPVPHDLLEEVYMRGYRRGLPQIPVAVAIGILFVWALTGSLLGGAQIALGFGVTLAALASAVQAAGAPVHRRQRFLRGAFYGGTAGWAVGGFAVCMPAVFSMRFGMEVDLTTAQALYAAANGLLLVAHVFLYGVFLRESLTVSSRPYATWARVALAWTMAAATLGVAAYITFARST